MDYDQSLLAILVATAPLGAALVAAAGALLGRPRLARDAVFLGAAVSGSAAAVAWLRSVLGWCPEGGVAPSLGDWLVADGRLRIAFGLRLETVAAAWCALTALATFCAWAWRSWKSDDDAPFRALGATLLLFSAQGLAMSTNLGELFVFWQLGGAGSYLLCSSPAPDAARAAAAAKRVFLVERVADALLMCGVFAFAMGFGSLDFDHMLRDSQIWTRRAAANGALVDFIGLCLFGASVARCALFPLLGRIEDLAHEPATVTAIVQGACLMPAGAVLLFRFLPLLQAAPAAASLAAFWAAASAFLAAVCAWAADESRRASGFAAASVLAIAVCGLASREAGMAAAGLTLLCVYLAAASGFLLASSASGEASYRERPFLSGSGVSAAVLFSGVCGQAWVFAGALRSLRTPGGAVDGPMLFIVGLIAAAEFFTAAAVARIRGAGPGAVSTADGQTTLVVVSDGTAATSLPIGRAGWPAAALSGGALLVGLLAVGALVLQAQAEATSGDRFGGALTGAVLGCLPSLAGFAVLKRRLPLASAWARRGAERPLMRLGRHRFYCDACLFLFVLLPVRAGAQFARFADWFFIDGVVTGIPLTLAESAAAAFSPVQRRSVAFYALSAVMGAAILAALIVWLRS
jgi:NADH:ubiquinone oxidoreductase subunit 5 (subunit L)/multisubunit Na+/H+ antiporter MnhA subunit